MNQAMMSIYIVRIIHNVYPFFITLSRDRIFLSAHSHPHLGLILLYGNTEYLTMSKCTISSMSLLLHYRRKLKLYLFLRKFNNYIHITKSAYFITFTKNQL